jgi:hypothetical protein
MATAPNVRICAAESADNGTLLTLSGPQSAVLKDFELGNGLSGRQPQEEFFLRLLTLQNWKPVVAIHVGGELFPRQPRPSRKGALKRSFSRIREKLQIKTPSVCWKELADENIRFTDDFGHSLLMKWRVFFSKLVGEPAKSADQERPNRSFVADSVGLKTVSMAERMFCWIWMAHAVMSRRRDIVAFKESQMSF